MGYIHDVARHLRDRRCDLMLFEGGLYCERGDEAFFAGCDLMLFEGGLYYFSISAADSRSCDLMLFEGGLY